MEQISQLLTNENICYTVLYFAYVLATSIIFSKNLEIERLKKK